MIALDHYTDFNLGQVITLFAQCKLLYEKLVPVTAPVDHFIGVNVTICVEGKTSFSSK